MGNLEWGGRSAGMAARQGWPLGKESRYSMHRKPTLISRVMNANTVVVCIEINGLGWALLKSSDHRSTSPPGHIPQYTHQHPRLYYRQRSSTLINAHQRSSTFINAHQRSSTLINVHQRPSTFINVHQRPSTLINVHQRPSTFINTRSTHPRRTEILTILFAPRSDGRYILLRR
jgi:hypothetical protein